MPVEKILGPFQERAKRSGFSEEIVKNLPMWCPPSEEEIKEALREAGYIHEETLAFFAQHLWKKGSDWNRGWI